MEYKVTQREIKRLIKAGAAIEISGMPANVWAKSRQRAGVKSLRQTATALRR